MTYRLRCRILALLSGGPKEHETNAPCSLNRDINPEKPNSPYPPPRVLQQQQQLLWPQLRTFKPKPGIKLSDLRVDRMGQHGAVYMAKLTSSGMIFIPCKDGISHNEIEDAKPEHITAGCNVLLHAMLERAGG